MAKRTVLDKLRGLQRQATEEKSHYYVGATVLEAISYIGRLEEALSHTLDSVTDDPDCPECRAARKLLGWPQ